MRLNELMPGQRATVTELRTTGGMRRRLLDIGLTERTTVTCVGVSPGGGLAAYEIRGAVVAIRKTDAAGVLIRPGGAS